jgi:hypothetical protein
MLKMPNTRKFNFRLFAAMFVKPLGVRKKHVVCRPEKIVLFPDINLALKGRRSTDKNGIC